MLNNYQFELVRLAKSNGGDRYEHGVKGNKDHMVFYIPQSVSRIAGQAIPRLFINITAAPIKGVDNE